MTNDLLNNDVPPAFRGDRYGQTTTTGTGAKQLARGAILSAALAAGTFWDARRQPWP